MKAVGRDATKPWYHWIWNFLVKISNIPRTCGISNHLSYLTLNYRIHKHEQNTIIIIILNDEAITCRITGYKFLTNTHLCGSFLMPENMSWICSNEWLTYYIIKYTFWRCVFFLFIKCILFVFPFFCHFFVHTHHLLNTKCATESYRIQTKCKFKKQKQKEKRKWIDQFSRE